MGLTEKEIIRISEILGMFPDRVDSVLEVGSGDGRVSLPVWDKYQLTGIDINKRKIRSFPGSKIVADISSLPLKSSRFDVVLATEVLEHLDNSTFASA